MRQIIMVKEYKLGSIAIMGSDLQHKIQYRAYPMPKMDYDTAISLADDVQDGKGWRLPTIEELKFLQGYHDLKVLSFSRDAYWTSDIIEYDQHTYNQYAYYFNGPRYGGIPKTERLCVRLVRDI
jgi:anionic cell wall polymer biosynthesis LytR-Cps2A-Psr (LCP) family protein